MGSVSQLANPSDFKYLSIFKCHCSIIYSFFMTSQVININFDAAVDCYTSSRVTEGERE